MAGSVLLSSPPWQKQAEIEPLWRTAAGRRGASNGGGGRRRHRRVAHVRAAATDSSTATEPRSKQRHRSKTAKTTQNGASAAAASEQAAMVLAAQDESLSLLEWPALCRQVACFAQTPLGAEVAARGALPIGRTQADSELLLQQTGEAQRAQLNFKGVYDVRQAIDAAEGHRVLHPLVLGAIATTLEAAARLQAQLQQQGEGGTGAAFPALQQLGAGIGDALPGLRQAIEQCIQPGEGRILDSASPALAEVRQARRANQAELRAEMDSWARQLHQKGVSERAQVVVRRERLCIPVRRGRQGELPKGSVTLAASESGNTLYMEPQPAVRLNNAETALAGREQEEEAAVLTALSSLVAQHARQLRDLLRSVTDLDVASARGRHGAWLGATQPPRFLSADEATAGGAVRLPRAWHPLLLQPCLPPLPALLLPDEPPAQLQEDALSGPLAALSLVPELAAAAAPGPISEVPQSKRSKGKGGASPADSSSSSSDEADGSSGGSGSSSRARLPQPVDLTVPPGVNVVAVTGPNTGGKTASLKALGLHCLMAKAGLFLPQAPAAAARAQQPEAQQAGDVAGEQLQAQQAQQAGDVAGEQLQAQQAQQAQQALLWFDRILADLGDGQSLQQSLSTFSGHVRRIRNVLAAATPQSLVLLDEVGSGTDPAEGAALAAALLERLQTSAALTYATTHHAELKELAATAPGFVNASVEFDVASLRPTYRLQWGAAGESNALAVAQELGFSPDIVAAARQVAQELHHSGQASDQRAAMLQASLVEQVEEAQAAARAAASARSSADAEAAAAQSELSELQQQVAELKKAGKGLAAAAADAKQRAQRVVADAKAGRISAKEAEAQLRGMEREAAPADAAAVKLFGLRAAAKGGTPADDGSSPLQEAPQGWLPAEGEAVRVLKMGGAVGRVVSAPGKSGGKVGVRVGAMTVELRLSDLAPAGSGQAAQPGAAPRRSGSGKGGSATSLKAAAKQLRARGSLSSSDDEDASSSGGGVALAIQTSRNTVDVRGCTADDAAAEVRNAVLAAPSGLALFVVHGVGTGRVRAAVLQQLRGMQRVSKMEEAEASNGGCTIVYIR